ncbi:Hypothetical predicted protein [Cloeon dipterum]|uniref:p53 DNA-binding domain-containing protein n=1 Tax=Cloeon dipterum TaxID=197152 RepID=A0A8S1E0M6_9INSE|nr:Hypothetical predicted protein [Cloeon dipterum]
MSFLNTPLDGDVPLAELHPSIDPGAEINASDYQIASSQESENEAEKESPDDVKPPPFNQATGEMPSTEEFSGHYEFSLLMGVGSVNDAKNVKKSWEYSLKMNKLYVKVGSAVPVSFKINNQLDWSDLKVRALLVYDNPDDARTPVERCSSHKDPSHKSNKDCPNVNHVLCCQHRNASYERDQYSGRYSVVVALGEPQAGATYATILYMLNCKSSCEGGISRRNTSIIFTLEKNNKVCGRHVVHVRICSCPKRDMNQEQEFLSCSTSSMLSRGKKRKLDHFGPIRIKSEGYPLPSLLPPLPVSSLNSDLPPQPRYEPLNYMEHRVHLFQVRSPVHYKILLTKAYHLFNYRVSHQAAIYEGLLKNLQQQQQ